MRIKTIKSLLFVLSLSAFTFASCSEEAKPEANTESENTEEVAPKEAVNSDDMPVETNVAEPTETMDSADTRPTKPSIKQ
ncbi:MAG: hypothetical protein R2831_08730 [Chitinophagaceae bacterium]